MLELLESLLLLLEIILGVLQLLSEVDDLLLDLGTLGRALVQLALEPLLVLIGLTGDCADLVVVLVLDPSSTNYSSSCWLIFLMVPSSMSILLFLISSSDWYC